VSFEGTAGVAGGEAAAGAEGAPGAAGAPAGGEGQQQEGAGGGDSLNRLTSSMESFMADTRQRLDDLGARIPAPAAAEGGAGAGGVQGEGFDIEALLAELPDSAFDTRSGELTPEGNLEVMRQIAAQEANKVRSEAAHEARQEYVDTTFARGGRSARAERRSRCPAGAAGRRRWTRGQS
jgi:hypothetical protein